MITQLKDQLAEFQLKELKEIYELTLDNNEYNNEKLLNIYNVSVQEMYGVNIPILTGSQMLEIRSTIEEIIVDTYMLNKIQDESYYEMVIIPSDEYDRLLDMEDELENYKALLSRYKNGQMTVGEFIDEIHFRIRNTEFE